MSCSSSDIFLIKAETYANSGDLGGVIFKQAQITLTYNNSPSNKKGEYILSSDHMEFDNFEYSGPSRNLYYCSKAIS